MKKKSGFSKILGAKGAGTVVTAFIGLIIIYIAFGILNPKVFSLLNIQNLLRSMSKYLLIGIGQSFVMITGNIDLSIGSWYECYDLSNHDDKGNEPGCCNSRNNYSGTGSRCCERISGW